MEWEVEAVGSELDAAGGAEVEVDAARAADREGVIIDLAADRKGLASVDMDVLGADVRG